MTRATAAALFGALVIFGFLLERAAALDREISAVALQLGAIPKTASPASAEPAPELDFERRIGRLEHAVAALSKEMREPGQPALGRLSTQSALDPDQAILASLSRAESKIVDQHLDFYREHWLDWRDRIVEQFEQRAGLSPGQGNRLKGLLADEIDAWVELLRRPTSRDNPEQFAKDWREILRRTDTATKDVLSQGQLELWRGMRDDERKRLWPWLPAD